MLQISVDKSNPYQWNRAELAFKWLYKSQPSATFKLWINFDDCTCIL